jgi:uncharacterized YigZ family protein
MNDSFLTLSHPGLSEIREKSSKFLGYAYPLQFQSEWEGFLEQVRGLHPKATHHCYAYRFGPGGDIYRANDDGEPSGSAGRPILGQMDSLRLNQVVVIVVRYYGGTKLGVPGLIQSYREAARLALTDGGTVEAYHHVSLSLEVPYALIPEIMRLGKAYQWEVLGQDFGPGKQTIRCQIRASQWLDFERDLHVGAGGIYPSEYLEGMRHNDLIISKS